MQTDDKQSTSDAPLLDVSGISYRYGSLNALTNAAFTVEPRQLVSLVGRNGAGKSTLLKCIAGWTQPTEGEIRIHGYPVAKNERYVREHLILVPDTPQFYDELTAWEHLQFVAQAHGWRGWEDDAEDLLSRYGLLSNKDAFPFTYSRGMRYKLALCMALLVEPEILLLDEPLGPLDPVSADELWIELNRHRSDGMAILFSSHQLPQEAQPDRYLIMEQGEIIADGTPESLRVGFSLDGRHSLDDLLRSAIQARKAEAGHV
ncbi:MAG: ABC transporter ATP-binding protein [Chloroflexi bacterium]|nr:ABC transporter ATP-binding protein [Chloroflexota bacterium]MDL1886030.1 ABC transporter ATP-binding protein [Anaerolineae bacterium CFX8]